MSHPFAPSETFGDFTTDQPLADYGPRFVAKVVDNVIAYAPFLPVLVAIAIYEFIAEIPEEPPVPLLILTLFCVLAVLAVAIYQWWRIATTGQTIGKKLLGIRIVKVDGSPVDFVSGVLLRSWVLGFVSGIMNQCCLGWVILVVDVAFIFGPERQCLHDRLASTKVVVAENS